MRLRPPAVMNAVRSVGSLSLLSRISHSQQWRIWSRRLPLKACLVLLVPVSFTGCTTTVSSSFPEDTMARAAVILAPGDQLKIAFPGNIELTQTQTIRADGKINLPFVGEVHAAGRTIADLQGTLEALYKPQLQNTTVVVTLEKSGLPVHIGGGVKKPGRYEFDRPTTVLEAIMEAGDIDQFGTLAKVKVIRLVNGQQRAQVLDLRPILQGKPTKPIYVHGGDIIIVGESAF